MEDIKSMFEDVLEEMAEGSDAYEQPKTFITDDKIAEWAIKKVKDEKAEMDRLTKLADDGIAYYQERKDEIKRRFESRIGNLTYHLGEYFKTVPHRVLKASEQYTLPSGKLSMKYGKIKQRFVNAEGDEDKGEHLVEWLEANGYEQYVKVTKTPAWSELKDVIKPDRGNWYMAATGEELDGIAAVKTEDEFEVK